jgi:hypothetical protein
LRLEAVLGGDFVLIGTNESAVANDGLAADVEAVGALRSR